MPTPLLEMRGITKRFPGVIALQDVDLSVYESRILALIGENGAGKSTLMKILGGIHQPDEGEIRVDDKPVVIDSVDKSIHLGIGFIHQELNVLDNLDVASNVFLGREPVFGGPLRLIDSKRLHEDTRQYLDRLDLRIPSRTPLAELSIAQRQMVEIAKALSLNARILIMDEPTSSLTLTETERLLEVAQDLREQGVGIIYISHRLGEIKVIADQVVALRDGRNAGELKREEINHDSMVRLMVGRDIKNFYEPPTQLSTESVFKVRDLCTQRYPQHEISFDVRRGEILGFSGLVGAGRTEVATAIFGVEPPVAGELELNGERVQVRSPRDAIDHGIYLVPEDRRQQGLVVSLPIRANISLPALDNFSTFSLVRRGEENAMATDFSKKLKVKTASVETAAANLSGGNQQKVVLAKWLAMNPKVLIFDEPTRGIDVGAKAEIYRLMRELAENGVAVIMISSDMEEILGESDRVAVMHEGRLTGILERAECSEEKIMELAVGKAEVAAAHELVEH